MHPILRTLLAVLGLPAALPCAVAGQDEASARKALVDVVARELRYAESLSADGAVERRVLAALGRVPRHEFVPPAYRAIAYANEPLPIGHGQTISQPTVVAMMTALLAVGPGSRVLEVGTGSGYQAAVLAELGAEVYTIEIVPELGDSARTLLARLGYQRVTVRVGDGYHGWPEHAPFDAVIVTAAANHIPPALLEQLKPGGRMAIPVGNPFAAQQLLAVSKDTEGRVSTRKVLPVRFVPLTGRD
jgi:protein-L-isoaspartate(D-aspartate) O-methyltransferase